MATGLSNMFENSLNKSGHHSTINDRDRNFLTVASPRAADEIVHLVSNKEIRKLKELECGSNAKTEAKYQAPYLAGTGKEQLYGETLKAKMVANEYREANKKLRTRLA